MKKKFKFRLSVIPFFGIGFGYQKRYNGIDFILLLPFLDMELTYNLKNKTLSS